MAHDAIYHDFSEEGSDTDFLSDGLKTVVLLESKHDHKGAIDPLDKLRHKSRNSFESFYETSIHPFNDCCTMAHDLIVRSVSPTCPGSPLWERTHHRRSRSHRIRRHHHRHNYIEDDFWDIGAARPRVSSMPTRPSSLTPGQKTSLNDFTGVSRVRSYTISSRGVVCRDECFIRRSRTSSTGTLGSGSPGCQHKKCRSPYKVLMLGSSCVGKSMLIKSFAPDNREDERLNFDEGVAKPVSILLDGEQSTMEFWDRSDTPVDGHVKDEHVDAYVVVYSVEDRRSYEAAINRLLEIREVVGRQVALILVANKKDLVRARVVTEDEGKTAAKTYGSKYIEVSAALELKIDELLVGVLKQIRLFKVLNGREKSRARHHTTEGCCHIHARENVLAKLFRAGKSTSRSCDNLYVL